MQNGRRFLFGAQRFLTEKEKNGFKKAFFWGIGRTEKERAAAGCSGSRRYLAVRLQLVQLSLAGMQESALVGKKASIGNSIWPNTSHGLSELLLPTFGQDLVGTQ